jgi:hypothetical protein
LVSPTRNHAFNRDHWLPAHASLCHAQNWSRSRDISAPFVATLVEVTGLIIYFSIALVIMSGVMLWLFHAVASALLSG